MAYGKEVILDLFGCDVSKFTRREIEGWLNLLCLKIDMKQEDLHFWDYVGVPEEEIPRDQPHLVGTSAVQFITTSGIVIHTLDMLGECYIDIFSCKSFKTLDAVDFTKDWFGAKMYEYTVVVRGKRSKCNNIPESDCMTCVSYGKCSGGRIFCDEFVKDSRYE